VLLAVAGIAAESGRSPSEIMESWTEPEIALVIAFRRAQSKALEAERQAADGP
jgi:hypothetical protein